MERVADLQPANFVWPSNPGLAAWAWCLAIFGMMPKASELRQPGVERSDTPGSPHGKRPDPEWDRSPVHFNGHENPALLAGTPFGVLSFFGFYPGVSLRATPGF